MGEGSEWNSLKYPRPVFARPHGTIFRKDISDSTALVGNDSFRLPYISITVRESYKTPKVMSFFYQRNPTDITGACTPTVYYTALRCEIALRLLIANRRAEYDGPI